MLFVSATVKKGSLIWLRRTNGRGHSMHIQMNTNGNRMRVPKVRENGREWTRWGRDVKREYRIDIGAVNASQKTNHFPSMRFYQDEIVCFAQYFVWIWFWNKLNANKNCFSIGMPRKKKNWLNFFMKTFFAIDTNCLFFRIQFPTSPPTKQLRRCSNQGVSEEKRRIKRERKRQWEQDDCSLNSKIITLKGHLKRAVENSIRLFLMNF